MRLQSKITYRDLSFSRRSDSSLDVQGLSLSLKSEKTSVNWVQVSDWSSFLSSSCWKACMISYPTNNTATVTVMVMLNVNIMCIPMLEE